jgi:hypothetical protein
MLNNFHYNVSRYPRLFKLVLTLTAISLISEVAIERSLLTLSVELIASVLMAGVLYQYVVNYHSSKLLLLLDAVEGRHESAIAADGDEYDNYEESGCEEEEESDEETEEEYDEDNF